MRDEYFNCLIDDFGEATSSIQVPTEIINKWTGILPDILLDYWKSEGWSSYKNGLFSLVNPDDYEDLLDLWLEGTPFEELDSYHVIAKTGFGKLFIFGENTGCNTTVTCYINKIISVKKNRYKKDERRLDLNVKSLVTSLSPEDLDIDGEDGEHIFERAVKIHGPLAENEVFGFVPAVILGGAMDVKNIKKMDAHIHLSHLREFCLPDIFEI
ncbi:GAD-like domain-containing protein [Hafnia paralvei]|uniref:GAD-like domain-containing protein n=1 Tax=Hafnia paralvei TaxID=546367 RepID=UPI003C2B56BD